MFEFLKKIFQHRRRTKLVSIQPITLQPRGHSKHILFCPDGSIEVMDAWRDLMGKNLDTVRRAPDKDWLKVMDDWILVVASKNFDDLKFYINTFGLKNIRLVHPNESNQNIVDADIVTSRRHRTVAIALISGKPVVTTQMISIPEIRGNAKPLPCETTGAGEIDVPTEWMRKRIEDKSWPRHPFYIPRACQIDIREPRCGIWSGLHPENYTDALRAMMETSDKVRAAMGKRAAQIRLTR